jgi:divalent anion:Na+ symporter, DASS family
MTILGFSLQPLHPSSVAFIAVTFSALSGTLTIPQALSGFGNSTVWLIVSGFLFAKGFMKTGLGNRMAYLLMRYMGGSTLKLGYTLVLSDLIISPVTPSNTARAGGLIFPVARSLCSTYASEPGTSARRVGAYLMQTAYHGNAITSAMYMTAMAGNPLVAVLAAKILGVNISWYLWALAASVPGIVSLILIPFILYLIYPPEITKTPEAKELAARELQNMGPISTGEKIVALIFVVTVGLWHFSEFTKFDPTIVAMLAVCSMLVLQVLSWQDALEEKGAWDTLVWMGTLVGFADILAKLGFIPWFAQRVGIGIAGIPWMEVLGVLLVVYMYSHYAFTSLTAHITALYASFVAVALVAGVPVYLAALSLGFISNLCMSLTHYAGGPSTIYFGAGYVPRRTWWILGLVISIANLIIWVGLGSVWWRYLNLW